MPFEARCCLCSALFKNRRSYSLNESTPLFDSVNALYELLHSRQLDNDCRICNLCYQKHSKRMKLSNKGLSSAEHSSNAQSIVEKTQVHKSTQTNEPNFRNKSINCCLNASETIQLPLYVPTTSHKYCSICSKQFGRIPAATINEDIRIHTLLNTMVYLRPDSRCCSTHIIGKQLSSNAIRLIQAKKKALTTVSKETLNLILEDIWHDWKRCSTVSQTKFVPIDFNHSLRYTDCDYWTLIGITKKDFNHLCDNLEMRNTVNRSVQMAVGCLLTKLRLGLSNRVMSILFSFSSKRVVGQVLESARESLTKHFVPNYLGFEHINRDKIIRDHTRPLAKHLLGGGKDLAILILDGTYIYCQKSACNLLQRRLYSMHKSRPLIKPMMCVASDGYICSAIGPYFADWRNNDANIINHVLRTNEEEILNWLEPGDIFVVDRGFRDSIDYIRSLGFNVYMPSFLSRAQKQYTTAEANRNRFITKIRWVVESVNGRVKQFKYFDKVIPNSALPYVHDYLRIVCSILNAYRSSLIDHNSKDDELAKAMLQREHKKNTLQKKLADKDFQKLKNWRKIDATGTAPDFPRLSQQQLQELTLGIFQIKQAKGYTTEHIIDDGSYDIMISTQTNGFIKAKIQSRHSNKKLYNVLIQYNKRTVLEWCCQCPYGNVTIGTCSHVASIIWYLGLARHDSSKMKQFSSNYIDAFQDASVESSNQSNDDDDDDEDDGSDDEDDGSDDEDDGSDDEDDGNDDEDDDDDDIHRHDGSHDDHQSSGDE